MGSVRTLLAISVVFAHSYGFMFVGGPLAVQLFYIISGFLISYILVEAKNYTSLKGFYKNRFLRLYPIYWIVALATFAYYFVGGLILNNDLGSISIIKQLDFTGSLALIASNILLVGQDWIMFTAFNDGIFHLTNDFRETDVNVWQGLLVPQAWTLGVEISFYLLAPFILYNKRTILILLAASLALRVYLIFIGLGLQDPWTYRFFPTELAFFLFGALSHQILKPYYEKLEVITNRSSYVISCGIFAFCFSFFMLPYKPYFALFLIAVFILSLPFLFHFQSHNGWDRAIGELSYPIYISHILTIIVFRDNILSHFGVEVTSLIGAIIVVIATIFVSFMINLTVGRFFESIRSKVKLTQNPNVITANTRHE
mgnify:CR=1 FL=1